MTGGRDPIYTAEAHVTGGRLEGHGRTSDGALEVDIRIPESLGGPGGGTNPEQLFAVGYASCFESALNTVGRRRKQEAGDVAIDSKVMLIPTAERDRDRRLPRHHPSVDPRRGGGRIPGQSRAPGVPLLERYPRQHRRGSHRQWPSDRGDPRLTGWGSRRSSRGRQRHLRVTHGGSRSRGRPRERAPSVSPAGRPRSLRALGDRGIRATCFVSSAVSDAEPLALRQSLRRTPRTKRGHPVGPTTGPPRSTETEVQRDSSLRERLLTARGRRRAFTKPCGGDRGRPPGPGDHTILSSTPGAARSGRIRSPCSSRRSELIEGLRDAERIWVPTLREVEATSSKPASR